MAERSSLLRLEKKELRWPLAVAVVIVALTCLPYLFGWAITPPEFHYSGFLSNADDHNVYFSYMRQAQEGNLVFVDQFTTEPQRPWFFHVFFLSLGLFSRISGLSLLATYQLARIIWGVLLLLALYVFGARFLESLRGRRFFLLFIALSSGLGWLYLLLIQPTGSQPHPPDFGPGVVMPELITFLTLLLHPLFSFSIFLLVSTLLLLMLAMEHRSWGWALGAGVAGILLANVHSYDSIPLAVTILLYLVGRAAVQRKLGLWEILPAVILGVMMLPPLLYQFHLYRDLPVFRLKAEVATLSPPLIQYLLAMGLPFVFFIPGVWMALRSARKQPELLLPLAWFVGLLVSAYLPFPFQRKMAEGMQIPVCLLGTLFLSGRVLNSKKLRSTILQGVTAAAILLLCFPSNGFFLSKVLGDLQTMGTGYYAYLMPPPYLREEQVNTLEWLEQQVSSDDAVLCNPLLGSYAPSRTGAKVYVGHWAETLNYPHKLGLLAQFYSGRMHDSERENLLQKEGIKYVLLGPEEKALAEGSAAFENLPLNEVNQIGEITIFQVED